MLPDDAELAEWLPRLGVDPLDAADLRAARPGPERYAELAVARDALVAGVGTVDGELPWPDVPGTGSYRHAWALLAALPAIRRYHRETGIPEDVSWHSLADFGLQLARHRRLYGGPGLASPDWLTLHFRGILYRLGRLQFQRTGITGGGAGTGTGASGAGAVGAGASGTRASGTGASGAVGPALSVHIAADGPLTPDACDESFGWAARFFDRYYPGEGYRHAVCYSWLLDGQLARYLPAEANIVRFQRRFSNETGGPAGEADLTVLKYVFDRPDNPLRPGELDALPRRTTLQRAIVDHLRAGGHWYSRTGRCEL